ncbi:MAG TPA: hypothetical protein VIR56_12620, partial [Solimonas sp.]
LRVARKLQCCFEPWVALCRRRSVSSFNQHPLIKYCCASDLKLRIHKRRVLAHWRGTSGGIRVMTPTFQSIRQPGQ